MCQSSYTIEEDSSAKELLVTQMVDISNCQQPAALYRGMALAPEDKLSKQVWLSNHDNPITQLKQVALNSAEHCSDLQRGENVVSTVKYIYTVKSTADGGLITKASAQERQYFSPFNVKGGNSRMLAM